MGWDSDVESLKLSVLQGKKGGLFKSLEFARAHGQLEHCFESDYTLRQIFNFVLLSLDHFALANNLVLQFYHGG
jgi:hypothetical protein